MYDDNCPDSLKEWAPVLKMSALDLSFFEAEFLFALGFNLIVSQKDVNYMIQKAHAMLNKFTADVAIKDHLACKQALGFIKDHLNQEVFINQK